MVALLCLSGCDSTAQRQSKVVESCSPQFLPETGNVHRAVLGTDSGMHGVWNPKALANICGYETWAANFLDNSDIVQLIQAGSFVPLYVHSDGAPLIEVRIGTSEERPTLSDEEQRILEAKSDQYLFVSDGIANVSGIEYIQGFEDPGIMSIKLDAGHWKIEVALLDVEKAPAEARDEIPDLIVLATPADGSNSMYRQSVETFTWPE